jgi:biopolymer transport protein ExbD
MNHILVIVVVIFVTFILVNCSSSHLSFAKKNNEKEEDDKDFQKDIFDLSIDKNKTLTDNLKELSLHNNTNNISNEKYPDQYFVCGYPKHLIKDDTFLEKINCDEFTS